MQLPAAYLNRMQTQLGGDFAAYLRAMEQPPRRALRVNTLKISPAAFQSLCDFPLEPSGLLPESFLFSEDIPIGRHPLHAAGLAYVQEASAAVPASLLQVQPGEKVLDLCAAPGGKSGQLAAALQGSGILIANEPVAARANILQYNLERLGVTNAVVTCAFPEQLALALPGYFDAVLVDAPCSGEGMFRKEPSAITDWSPENVVACARRQQDILASADRLLRPGGRMVYSTCTFSAEEDELAVAAFCDAHPAYVCRKQQHYYPHTCAGEGQFAAVLKKREDAPVASAPARRAAPQKKRPIQKEANPPALAMEFFKTYCTVQPSGTPALLADGRVVLLPENLPSLTGIRVLRAGLLAGTVRGSRFEPDHALFLGLGAAAFRQNVCVAGAQATRFLAGETLPCDALLAGWCAVCWNGYPLGFGKAVQGTLKNHLPKGLRIL